MTRRVLLATAGVGAAAYWLSGCGAARPGGGGPITLRLVGAGDPALYAALLPQFEQANQGIRVQFSPAGSGGQQALMTALLTGSGPDVFWDDDPSRYLGTPLVADLNPLARQSGYDLGDFGTSVLDAFRSGGSLFMLPRTVSPSAYAVRTDVLAGAGALVPDTGWTSSDLAATWRQVSAGGRAIGGRLDWTPQATYYLNGWGAHLVDPEEPRHCALQTAAAVRCGQWMWDRFTTDASAQGPLGQNPAADFWAGTLAMQIVDAAGIAAFASRATTTAWQLAPFPQWPAGPSTLAATDFYALSAGSAHMQAAWRLLAFLTGVEAQKAAITSALVPPSRHSLWDEYLAALATAAPPLPHKPLQAFADPVRQDWARPPERFRFQPQALAVLEPYWLRIFGPHSSLQVSAGFAAATADVDAAEQAAAAQARTPARPLP